MSGRFEEAKSSPDVPPDNWEIKIWAADSETDSRALNRQFRSSLWLAEPPRP